MLFDGAPERFGSQPQNFRLNMCSATASPTTVSLISRHDAPTDMSRSALSTTASFTNGPVAVQLLAESLGLTANASLWLTAQRASGNELRGRRRDIRDHRQATGSTIWIRSARLVAKADSADPNALYVVLIGGNDVRNAALYGAGAPAITDGVDTVIGGDLQRCPPRAPSTCWSGCSKRRDHPRNRTGHPTLAGEATAFQSTLRQGAGRGSWRS